MTQYEENNAEFNEREWTLRYTRVLNDGKLTNGILIYFIWSLNVNKLNK